MHFWGFTANGTGQIWLLQALYLLSGYKTPVPLVMRAGNSSGSDPPHREIVPQRGGGEHRIPFKTSPSSHFCVFPLTLRCGEGPTLMNQQDLPGLFPPAGGGFFRQSRFLRDSAANCLQVIMPRHFRFNGFVCWLFGLLESPWAGHFRSTTPFIQSQFRTSAKFPWRRTKELVKRRCPRPKQHLQQQKAPPVKQQTLNTVCTDPRHQQQVSSKKPGFTSQTST